MTEARVFKVDTNLSKQMNKPGGILVQSAVRAANAALASHRDEAMATIAKALSSLETVCAAKAPGMERQVYTLASELLDLAGFFDTGPLYEATYSLCEVSDRMQAGTWDWKAIAVHLSALRLILADGCRESEMTKIVLAGLRSVTEHKTSESR